MSIAAIVTGGYGTFARTQSIARGGYAAYIKLPEPPAVGIEYTVVAVKEVTAATNAEPPNLTVTGHGLVTGSFPRIVGLGGMTELNGNRYHATRIDDDHITLQEIDATDPDDWVAGADVDATAYGTFTSGGFIVSGDSVLEGASPLPVDGDIIISEAVSDPDGFDIAMQADGVPIVDVEGSTAPQSFGANIYDVSVDGFMNGSVASDLIPFSFNYANPAIVQAFDDPTLFYQHIDFLLILRDYIAHDQFDLTYALAPGSDPLPTGISISTEEIEGSGGPETVASLEGNTAASPGTGTVTIRASITDLGIFADFNVNYQVKETAQMVDVVGQQLADGTTAIEGVGLFVGSVFEVTNDADAGIILSQSPVEDEWWPIDEGVTLFMSSGPESDSAGLGGGLLPGILTIKRRRSRSKKRWGTPVRRTKVN